MARPWRIQFENACYHVMARGNNRQDIFRGDADRKHFLELLARASDRFHFHIFSFCLMRNHFHLFLRTPEANLSAGMHWLLTSYVVWFQRKHQYAGHLLQGRYKAVLVLDEAYWHHLSIYIHLNPFRAGLVKPSEYIWSSFDDYIHPRPRYEWLHRDDILSGFGAKPAEQRRNYRQTCLALSGKDPSFWDRIRRATVLGSKEALKQLLKKYRPEGDQKYVPEYTRAVRPEFELEKELGRIASIFKVAPPELHQKHRNFPARPALYFHLTEQCGMKASEVATQMGVSVSSISMGLKRFREMVRKNPGLGKAVRQLSFK